MKSIKFFSCVFIGLLALMLSSCNTPQNFVVQGQPGTVICSPTNERLAVIDNTGTAQVTLYRKNDYFHYLQAQAPGSNQWVPFALDYKDHNRTRRGVLWGTGMILCSSVTVSSAATGIAFAATGLEAGGILTAAGIGAAGCTILGLIAPKYAFNAGKYGSDYDYLPQQSTNEDLLR